MFKTNVMVGSSVVVLTALVLNQLGRVWWCKCGSPVPWAWDIWSTHNSQHAIDPYTFTHILHGVILCGLVYLPSSGMLRRYGLAISLVLEACWEVLENSPFIIERYREATISLDYFGDSIINSLFDIVACGFGYLLARRLGWKWSIVLVVATECLLLVWIRDSLLLNIIMLVAPNDAILRWQMGG